MKVIKFAASCADLSVSYDELLLIHGALNEVCNGIEVFEFETRLGLDRERALIFMSQIGVLIDEIDK